MSALDFRISSAHLADDAYILSIGGEVDLFTAPQLEEGLSELTAAGARRIVVDLAGAAFIDSTVLGVLLKTLTRLDAGGGGLVLVSNDRRVPRGSCSSRTRHSRSSVERPEARGAGYMRSPTRSS